MPTQKGVRSDETGDFCQESPAEGFALHRQPSPFVVRETESPPEEPSFEDLVLLKQVDDSGLLLPLDPTSDGNDEECQGLDRRAHDGGF